MKHYILLVSFLCVGMALYAQKNYPEPEFTNEVYYLKKDSVYSAVRLEKGSSKMETKTKMGGFGGMENGYEIEGAKSTTRISSVGNLSFVISTGASASSSSSSVNSAYRDSMMRANGADPSMMNNMNDPSNTINLYKLETGKDKRKVLLQKSPGMLPFGSKKMKSSDKYTFSVKKIKEGYWELVIDKPLPKGEYAFTMQNTMNTGMDFSILIFAFAID